jgi:hypothetical protein
VKKQTGMKVPGKYEPIDANEFERFDQAMTRLMRVPYSEVQRRIEADERVTGKKKKARKKRAKSKASRRDASRDSGEA